MERLDLIIHPPHQIRDRTEILKYQVTPPGYPGGSFRIKIWVSPFTGYKRDHTPTNDVDQSLSSDILWWVYRWSSNP